MGRRAVRIEATLIGMRQAIFRLLARINRAVLPKQWDRDLNRLSKARKLLAAYRYWVTRNALDR